MKSGLQTVHNTYKWLTAKTIDNRPWYQMEIRYHVKQQVHFHIGLFDGYQIELTKKFKMSGEIQIPIGTCSPSSINKNGIYSFCYDVDTRTSVLRETV